MITQVPLDVMHLIDLGVMRKFLLRVINNKSKITKEFVRKPRSLDEISNWKATEFRMFLFYFGIYVLKDELPNDIYYEFLLLHCVCRLLFCPKNYITNIEVGRDILILFVNNFAAVFGDNRVSYNVHGFLHISEDIRELGIPSTYSTYSFENYLQILKSYVKKPTQILQQITNMLKHEKIVTPPKFTGYQIKNYCIKNFHFDDFSLSSKFPNNYCSVKPFQYIEIQNFKDVNSKIIKGKKLLNLQSFFIEPIDSSTLGICTADLNPSCNEEEFLLDDVEYKLMCITLAEKILLIPILHTCM
ncbi:PREDICTED: uncharacterized protein LOC108358598 isoform X1 [Rhagoletis zephyria]|uniref:uncharacterized protein LOC108358598 isoform X1 n=1 Tax=Rhagoletis zephyria TaxID=28612 RepID=UPI0008118A2B|nr:PREDICTED: uncharacterized protein LOC108358598 isoform X1 [Rhagoletis zephyria]